MDKEKDEDLYVVNDEGQKAFKMLRDPEGELQAEFKVKARNKGTAKYFTVNALDVVDQVTEAMNREERLRAYANLIKKIKI